MYDAALVFETRIPDAARAYYRLRTRVCDGDVLIGTQSGFITVLEQKLEARLELAQTQLRCGETLGFTLRNDGPGPLFLGADYRLDRLEAGVWVEFPHDRSWPDVGHRVHPGKAHDFSITIPPGVTPARFRVAKPVRAEGTEIKRDITGEFNVVA